MLELTDNELVFRFPDVHADAVCRISFQRTLRVPDDNKAYDLPAGLGEFEVRSVSDYPETLSDSILKTGGALIPMYQSEALWINFESSYPFAVQIATGKKDAITGNDWTEKLSKTPQNYAVLPNQNWVDGFCIGEGLVRQFIAMPLGQGYSIEEQLGGTGDVGGIQLRVVPVNGDIHDERQRAIEDAREYTILAQTNSRVQQTIAPGGLIKQQIVTDRSNKLADFVDLSAQRCFVHIVNSDVWGEITGEPLPSKPITKAEYAENDIPWFEYYDDSVSSLSGSMKLKGVQSVAAKHIVNTGKPLEDNSSMEQGKTFNIGKIVKKIIDGDW
jgi:hypothetical protein